MYKIALLGVENSHAKSFLQLIQKGLYPEITVIGVYSCEPEASAKLHDEFGVYVAKSYDEFVGKVDAIIITARHGDNHYKYAKPYIKSGIPIPTFRVVRVVENGSFTVFKNSSLMPQPSS